ncbi:hypothetical protein [Alkalicoccus halolimnae]|uniref:Uncharacterized protein n=1 Tax=Alkalicoccus halolimnae TaxID=1667239 RepID=A0A5C7F8Y5_9BACI|nr:hypothetical protein [Alkalicoccus halolimnae]TXF85828.1 hypothetical protein FTX54_07045 [Alkalicoccus halolimnae]
MIYLLVTAAFLVLLGILLLIPSVFTYKITILLVTISYVYALLGVWSFSVMHWGLALGLLLVLALLTSYLTAARLPEDLDDEVQQPGQEQPDENGH